MAELSNVQGRPWDDIDVSLRNFLAVTNLQKSNRSTALSASHTSWFSKGSLNMRQERAETASPKHFFLLSVRDNQ